MKPIFVQHLLRNRINFMVAALLAFSVLAGCEGRNDLTDSRSTLDTGTISFDVTWNRNPDVDTDFQAKAVICGVEPNQVATVSAAIVSTATSVVRMGGPWECTAPSGTIRSVPVGSGYTLLFYGHNDSGQTTYSGTELGISVNPGNNDIGTIAASQFFAEMISPLDASSGIDPDNATFSWQYASGAAGYQLWISESVELSDPLIFDTNNLSFTLPTGILMADTPYFWTVFPIDIYDVRSWFYFDTYSFTTAAADIVIDDNYEPNDIMSEAFDLSDWDGLNLSSLNGEGVAVFNDPDYYRIEVPYSVDATIEISCMFSHALGDIDMELLAAGGAILENSISDTDDEFISYAHSGGPSTYFVKVWRYGDVDTNPNPYDLIWYARPAAPLDVNLTHYYNMTPPFDVSFRLSQSTLTWGDTVNVNFAVINNGSEDTPSETGIWVRLYLSANNLISELDYLLENRVFGYGLLSGYYIYPQPGFEWEVTLPIFEERPPGFPESGEFYIGMIIDPDNLIIETDEYDNSNRGEGMDYAPVMISP